MNIAICTNNYENIKKYSIPLTKELSEEYRIDFYIDRKCDIPELHQFENTEYVYYHVTNITGLSNLRNLALENCKNKYILFLDDDVTTSLLSLNKIIEHLKSYEIVGLYLSPPLNYELFKWHISKNQYHYLGLHSVCTDNDVWGASMAFNIEVVNNEKLKFDESLGRNNGLLTSGEDTTFINSLTEIGYKKKLIYIDDCIHHISNHKLDFSYMCKRVFAQGITEVLRDTKYFGFLKEFKRNFHHFSFSNFILGIWWMIVFFTGVIYGIFKK